MNTPALLVAGGGPAGALAARELARGGARVTLFEARAAPHDKVCGSCLHPEAVDALGALDLGDLLDAHGAPRLTHLELREGRRVARLALPLGRVLSRRALDAALLDAAASAGVDVRRGVRARSLEHGEGGVRAELVDAQGVAATARADAALLAHGLGPGPALSAPASDEPREPAHDASARRARGAARAADARGLAPAARRLGAGAVLVDLPEGPPTGTLLMVVGAGGYLGAVRLECGRLDLAAALDAEAVQRAGGPAHAAAALLAGCRHPLAEAAGSAAWSGTPPLAAPPTRDPPRVLRLGDAAGSVEPFTGEGLRRAFRQAAAVAPFARAAARGEAHAGARWSAARAELLRACEGRVDLLARVLRRPRLVGLGLGVAARWPRLGARLAERLHGTAGGA